ncbi:unnamed protein product [Staurois parvus]|uniref:Uncharacterized protein n=1 Tax=Staurois parvus TaxID=386267 RepID=A0ABN9DJS1_9NEOB|nr:unnamed protein product [Staurois parvus]
MGGSSGEVLETSVGGGDKGAREQEVLREAERTVWVIFGDKIGDVIWGGVINGFICDCYCFEFYSLGNGKPVEGLAERGGGH